MPRLAIGVLASILLHGGCGGSGDTKPGTDQVQDQGGDSATERVALGQRDLQGVSLACSREAGTLSPGQELDLRVSATPSSGQSIVSLEAWVGDHYHLANASVVGAPSGSDWPVRCTVPVDPEQQGRLLLRVTVADGSTLESAVEDFPLR